MIIRGMNLPLIIGCAIIVLALIVFPLIVSYKAEKKVRSSVVSLILLKQSGIKLKNMVSKLIKKLETINNSKNVQIFWLDINFTIILPNITIYG